MKTEKVEKMRVNYHINKEVAERFIKISKEKGLNMSKNIEIMIVELLKNYKE